jgi:hypothetical protein
LRDIDDEPAINEGTIIPLVNLFGPNGSWGGAAGWRVKFCAIASKGWRSYKREDWQRATGIIRQFLMLSKSLT